MFLQLKMCLEDDLYFCISLQLQQVLDSFIIFAAQQNEANMVNENIELPSNTSLIKQSWMQFIPSNIKIVPFPTREYTDDEFQSIIKSVMGLLYASFDFSCPGIPFWFLIIFIWKW